MALIKAGQIVLLKFPNTNLDEGKLRPVLIISKLPGIYNDWLTCMISTKFASYSEGIDYVINAESEDFKLTGLKNESVIRVLRLAVVNEKTFLGNIGEINNHKLAAIKGTISSWIKLN